MFGLGKKNVQPPTPVVPDQGLRIHTIPKAFYGKTVVEDRRGEPATGPTRPVVVAPPIQPLQQPIIPPPSSVGTVHNPRHEASSQAKKKWLIIGSGILVCLLVIGGATWYYTKGFTFGDTLPTPAPQAPLVVEPTPQPIIEEPPVVEPPAAVALKTTGLHAIPPYVDTIDFDTDSLTDIEEELYKSDMAAPDSDADGHHDGLEVVNLYDPMIAAPALIVSSTNVAVYSNTIHGYSLLHPQDWFAAAVDESTKDEVLFTSKTGEFMALRSFALLPDETFISWLTKNNSEVRFEVLVPWKNRMGVSGWYEPNGMRFYFANATSVFVLQYEPGIRTAINFRTSLRMMAESFAYVSGTTTTPPTPLPGIQELPTSTIPPPDSSSTSTPPVTS